MIDKISVTAADSFIDRKLHGRQIDGMKRPSTLTIKKVGDKFAGTMSWPDQKETKLKGLKLKDGALTFFAQRKT